MNDFNDDLPENIRLAMRASAPNPGEERVERVWGRLRNRNDDLGGSGVGAVREPPVYPKRDTVRHWGYASIAVVIAIGITYIFANGSRTAPTTTGRAKTYSTIPGQRATITLADGSTMILAPATSAVVDISKDARTVTLTGQAYFAVTSDAARSFSINTAAGTTRVLGTRFTVRQYQDEKAMRVAVTDGKVSIPGAVLVAGSSATVSVNTEPRVTNNASDVNAWTEGRLIFRNTPIREVLDELERWYDIQINLRDKSLASRNVTAILSDAAFTDETLRALSIAFNSRAIRNGRIITFTGVAP